MNPDLPEPPEETASNEREWTLAEVNAAARRYAGKPEPKQENRRAA